VGIDEQVSSDGWRQQRLLAWNVSQNSGPLIVESHKGDTGVPMSSRRCVTRWLSRLLSWLWPRGCFSDFSRLSDQ
jgi:hypothetical protein